MKLAFTFIISLVAFVAGAQISISPNTVVEGGSSTIVLSGGIANRSDKIKFGFVLLVLSLEYVSIVRNLNSKTT